MKKYILAILVVVFVLVAPGIDGCGIMPILADGLPIAQGVTVVQATIFQPSKGWRPIGEVPANTPIGIYSFDGNYYVRNDPDQAIERKFVRVYGVDKVPQTNWGSPLLGTAGTPVQVGEAVYAKQGCHRYFGCWEGGYSVPIPEGARMEVKNRQGEFLFVNLSGNVAGWVKEDSVERKVVVAASEEVAFDWDNVVLVVVPLASHLAGNGRSINVTLQQAEEAFRAVLAGRGQIFSRASDGRIMFDIVLGPYRYVGFVNSLTGNLDNFFLPAERYQEAHQGWNIRQVLQYIENLKVKGGYSPINPNQIPEWIKDKWLGSSPLAMARAVIQTPEVCMVFMIMPQYQLRRFSDPRVNVTN